MSTNRACREKPVQVWEGQHGAEPGAELWGQGVARRSQAREEGCCVWLGLEDELDQEAQVWRMGWAALRTEPSYQVALVTADSEDGMLGQA